MWFKIKPHKLKNIKVASSQRGEAEKGDKNNTTEKVIELIMAMNKPQIKLKQQLLVQHDRSGRNRFLNFFDSLLNPVE